jgi:hypothetical protein
MSDEKPESDLRHVHFPEVPSFRTSRAELAKKLEEIGRAFEEIEKRRAAMKPLPPTGKNEENPQNPDENDELSRP